jgi:hypothetical protein
VKSPSPRFHTASVVSCRVAVPTAAFGRPLGSRLKPIQGTRNHPRGNWFLKRSKVDRSNRTGKVENLLTTSGGINMNRAVFLGAAVLASTSLVAHRTQAAQLVLEDASGGVFAASFLGDGSITDSGVPPLAVSFAIDGVAAATAYDSIRPEVSATSSEETFSSAGLSYQFAEIGPQTIPVSISAIGLLVADVQAPGGGVLAISSAGITINGPDGTIYTASACASATPSDCDGFGGFVTEFNIPMNLVTNTPYTVSILAGSETSGPVSASGLADPFLFADPSFTAAHPDYQLILSPGVGNAPPLAIPEPATWFLLILGCCGVGSAVRANRRKSIYTANVRHPVP